MTTFDLIPHHGFGPVLLGMSRADARRALEAAGLVFDSSRDQSDYYASAAVQIESDDRNRVWFIGVNANDAFTTILYGLDVFDTPAAELFDAIAQREARKPAHIDLSEYTFREQIVALWEADEQYDVLGHHRRPIWAQVAIGNADYLRACDAILRPFAD